MRIKYDLGHQRPRRNLQALQCVFRHPAWPDSQALGYTDQAGVVGQDPVLSLAVPCQRCFVWKVQRGFRKAGQGCGSLGKGLWVFIFLRPFRGQGSAG